MSLCSRPPGTERRRRRGIRVHPGADGRGEINAANAAAPWPSTERRISRDKAVLQEIGLTIGHEHDRRHWR